MKLLVWSYELLFRIYILLYHFPYFPFPLFVLCLSPNPPCLDALEALC